MLGDAVEFFVLGCCDGGVGGLADLLSVSFVRRKTS